MNRFRAFNANLQNTTHLSIGAAIVWSTVLLPVVLIYCKLMGLSLIFWSGVSTAAAPVLYLVYEHFSTNLYKRCQWFCLQVFGAGSIALTCITISWLLHLLWPALTETISFAYTAIWMFALVLSWSLISACMIRVNSLSIKSNKLNNSLRLVHLTDVHLGSRESGLLEQLVERATGLQPDLVAITGDLIDRDWVSADDLAALAKLDCPVYFSMGNHEFDIDWQRCIRLIEAQGVTVLRDKSIINAGIEIIGIDDREEAGKIGSVLSRINPDRNLFQVLLYHRPDGWQSAINHGIDLTLAGHTHGGQIWPFSICVKWRFKQMCGYFRQGLSHLYVSAGAGTWGPTMRLGPPAEITLITLDPDRD